MTDGYDLYVGTGTDGLVHRLNVMTGIFCQPYVRRVGPMSYRKDLAITCFWCLARRGNYPDVR